MTYALPFPLLLVSMHLKLLHQLPFVGGLILGTGLTVLFIFIASSQLSRDEHRWKRDIKSIKTETPDSDHIPYDPLHSASSPSNENQDIPHGQERTFIDIRSKHDRKSLGLDLENNYGAQDQLLHAFVLIDTRSSGNTTAANMTWATGRKDVTFSVADQGNLTLDYFPKY